ncbi:MAG: hypothetical protein IKU39_00615 [Lachnospiraceae bacterium]|nr:hypothetical protein [Lachnospiraceae bacterium]
MLATIVMIISAVLAIVLVNFVFRMIATILGGTLFYSVKIKLIAYLLVFFVIFGLLGGGY